MHSFLPPPPPWRQFKPLRKYQYGPKGGKSYNPGGGAEGAGVKGYYEEADNEMLHEALHDVLDWTDPAAADVELTADELFLGRPGATGEVVIRGLKAKQHTRELVDFIFRRFDFCTRWQDPPPAEPEFMDLLRELQRQALHTTAHITARTPHTDHRPQHAALTPSPGSAFLLCPCLRVHKSICGTWRAGSVCAARGRGRACDGELCGQVRVLTDAHALCQRKLDAVIAGQTM